MCYLAFVCNAQAQLECGTQDLPDSVFTKLPWYGNETYLQNYYDSLANTFNNPNIFQRSTTNDIEPVWYRIPIKFWIHRLSATNAGGVIRIPNDRDIKRMMDNLNEAFRRENLPARFYIQCVQTVNSGVLFVNSYNEANVLNTVFRDNGAVNVHIIEDVDGNDAAGVYYPLSDHIILDRIVAVDNVLDRSSTLTHEIGHFFGVTAYSFWFQLSLLARNGKARYIASCLSAFCIKKMRPYRRCFM